MKRQEWLDWLDEQGLQLQEEIELFLQEYDPNKQEHIL